MQVPTLITVLALGATTAFAEPSVGRPTEPPATIKARQPEATSCSSHLTTYTKLDGSSTVYTVIDCNVRTTEVPAPSTSCRPLGVTEAIGTYTCDSGVTSTVVDGTTSSYTTNNCAVVPTLTGICGYPNPPVASIPVVTTTVVPKPATTSCRPLGVTEAIGTYSCNSGTTTTVVESTTSTYTTVNCSVVPTLTGICGYPEVTAV